MAKRFVVGYVLSCLIMTIMQGSEKVKITTSGDNILRCSQEILNRSQELRKKEKSNKSIAQIVTYYDGYCAGFTGIMNRAREQLAPIDPHYRHDFV